MRSNAIIVMTNQNNLLVGDGKRLETFTCQLVNVLAKVGSFLHAAQSIWTLTGQKLPMPIFVYCATRQDWYRKPRTGMWNRMERDFQLATRGACYFVGDAAGRPSDWSCADRYQRHLSPTF
jgi:bifunctional polynucleotide phosphatase/kinase